ncbi:uncharacterized protein LAESUDRAFT_761794 [Laetiporus sulphureus 93-53]|uniref:RING-type domain-containing protein n=1 Tax=Laetiporus sulphureus 93-53 TaxID=1314785 RepID=A0A165CXW1_9APHY|nr:uncharacterized protein LAESUDRAFT_761794 [Laetiporus sulphureus 93-53]KZT03702.1 hypothetical protein LAESUDRAFT_761794 [Laetiporus sulphureus 93-53]
MLVLHPSSTCDVCLETYNNERDPHSISCGHTFCLRCLHLLTRRCCPLCRRDFDPGEVRRLHVSKDGRSANPAPSNVTINESSSHAQQWLKRITRIVREGALASEVSQVLEDVHQWLMTQGPDEHADLRSAHLLLYQYTHLQSKCAKERQALADLQRTCHDIEEQIRLEREAADARYQDLERSRAEEQAAAQAAEKSLRERHDEMDKEWSGLIRKYEACLAECRKLSEELQELKRTRHNPLPTPPRLLETRYFYAADRNISSLELLPDADERQKDSTNMIKVQVGNKEDVFRLSPVPPTLPIPSLPTPVFPPLKERSDDQNDDKDKAGERMMTGSYVFGSTPPIPMKHSIHRAPSSSSLLSRLDDPMSQSLTRSILDVHMGSCSCSPSSSILNVSMRERQEPVISRPLDAHRPSVGSMVNSREQEERRERACAQLRDLLNDPSPSSDRAIDSSLAKQDSSEVENPTSTVKSLSRSSTLHRPSTVQWASEAAKAAQRARSSSTSTNASPTAPQAASQPSSQMPLPRDRDILPPSQSSSQPLRPSQSRKISTESFKTGASHAAASGLTRSLWATQEPTRVS